MDKYPDQKRAVQYLYPPIDPFDQRMVDMGDGHRIYVEQCGNPDGIPVVILHGGPGGGCSPAMRRYFDPRAYRVILFDQRGCGRSRPTASVENNTTWHLVADIERLRELFEIDEWIVFGGSWGATLALIYAQTHPDRVSRLVLRGVFLATQAELDWFYGGGAGRFWPEHWQKFTALLPEGELDDTIAAYNKRLFSGDRATEILYARAWSHWENALASIHTNGSVGESPGEYARTFARLENHYFINKAFLERDGQILDQMDRIADIPGHIVQGRYDMICPPQAAWNLAERWPNAELKMVRQAGHALSEPGISAELVRIMDRVAEGVA
ncbi:MULTISPECIES: prolyl aminopeptidase [unclassified Ruegeria]|uniref:prolyl aminopeptidase n=1 Tax=unclassified Ruegeria TaxID=2625375 RepID=UPI0014880B0A|nr:MULTISPECIES: prolyl aminopeptidase [unclassified Ruegeria]NOD78323.1 prolyl aminopeptidase [Ruegeria sp. HKCCD4332]NOD90557.1 prolyl aminopeptidase [Ruegeria sp. HKCCD4318]NOD94864.1 prolyl aminopeptidase [Ruegeria sp. HKCCD4884]NOE15940.1 prolyl aminopeptidase [Ruegeria sp. HKCCD4318-2]NOG10832.1 prolyl aminopeptidase [Ruegeria sp. HKCCD4315]